MRYKLCLFLETLEGLIAFRGKICLILSYEMSYLGANLVATQLEGLEEQLGLID